jgi:hypothetical protein
MRPVSLTAMLLGLVGCNPVNPFDPDIPSGAFQCEAPDFRCPAGLECIKGRCLSAAIQPDGTSSSDAEIRPDGSTIKGILYLDGAVSADAGECADANREPNNSSNTATFLASLGNYSLEICYPGDVDHLSILVPAGERLRATIQFSHAEGDLDAALLDPDGGTVVESKGYDNSEVLLMDFDAPVSGRYIVGVVGHGGAVNRYTLELEFD